MRSEKPKIGLGCFAVLNSLAALAVSAVPVAEVREVLYYALFIVILGIALNRSGRIK